METGNGDGANRRQGITLDEMREIAFMQRSRIRYVRTLTLELSTLCNIKACAIIIGKDGEIETWPENQNEVKHVIDVYNVACAEKKDKIETLRSMSLWKMDMLRLVDSKLKLEEGKNKRIATMEGKERLQMTVRDFFKALNDAISSNESMVEETNQIDCSDGVREGANPRQGICPNERAKPKMTARRYATRKNNININKKTMELSRLGDIKACSIFIGENGGIETWPENQSEVKDVIDSYRNYDVRAKRTPNVACTENKDKTEEVKREIKAVRRGNLKKAEMLSLVDSKLEYVNERLDSINTGKLGMKKNKGIEMSKGKERLNDYKKLYKNKGIETLMRLDETVCESYLPPINTSCSRGIETLMRLDETVCEFYLPQINTSSSRGLMMQEASDETVSIFHKKLDKEKNKGMSEGKQRLDQTVSEFYRPLISTSSSSRLMMQEAREIEMSKGKERLDETVSEFYKPLIDTSSSRGLMMQEAREIDLLKGMERLEERDGEFYTKLDKEKNKGIETLMRLDETVREFYKPLIGTGSSRGLMMTEASEIEMSKGKERLDETVSKGIETSKGRQRLDETVSEFYKPLIGTSSSSGLMMQEAHEIDFMGLADRKEEKGSDDELPPPLIDFMGLADRSEGKGSNDELPPLFLEL